MLDATQNENLSNAFDKATRNACDETRHMLREAAGVVSAGVALMAVYAALNILNNPLATAGCDRMNSLLREAADVGYLNLLTITGFLVALAMLTNGSPFSRNVIRWTCQPILKLFTHSCSLTLGITVSYMLLMIPEVAPRGPLRVVAAFSFLIVVIAGFTTFLYFMLAWVKRPILVSTAAKAMRRHFPKISSDDACIQSERFVSIAGAIAALTLAIAAWQQLHVDAAVLRHPELKQSELFQCDRR